MMFNLFKLAIFRNQPYEYHQILFSPILFQAFSLSHSKYQIWYFSILLSINFVKLSKFNLEKSGCVFLKPLETYFITELNKLVSFSVPNYSQNFKNSPFEIYKENITYYKDFY